MGNRRLMQGSEKGVTCDGPVSYPRGSTNIPSHFMQRKPTQALALWATKLVCRLNLNAGGRG